MSNGGPSTLANQDIIDLVTAGLDSPTLIAAITSCPKVTFVMDVAGLKALASGKVPSDVIHAMQMKLATQPSS